jgi:hypothetical protein
MEYEIYKSNELCHYGVQGMRWGIRRYQNKDGSLTPAGQKRRAKLEGKLEQLNGKKSNSGEAAPRKKTVSEMTEDELRERTNRMRAEKDYYDAARNLAAANPRKVSKGERFMNSLMNDVVAPAAKNTGKAWLEKFMKDKLGLNEKDPLDRLEKEARKLKATKEIEEYKKAIEKLKSGKDDGMPEIKTWDDVQKAQKYYEDRERNRKKEEDDG